MGAKVRRKKVKNDVDIRYNKRTHYVDTNVDVTLVWGRRSTPNTREHLSLPLLPEHPQYDLLNSLEYGECRGDSSPEGAPLTLQEVDEVLPFARNSCTNS